MGTEVTIYRPKRGADISFSFKDKDDNVTYPVARKLHEAWVAERHAAEQKADLYMPNKAYPFDNGITFRLFDDETSRVALEITAVPHSGQSKAELLAQLPQLLEKAGVDAEITAQIRQEVAISTSPKTPEPPPRP